MDLAVVLGILAVVSLFWACTTSNKPSFKKGDVIIPYEAESWEKNVLVEVLEVGKNKYRLRNKTDIIEYDRPIDEVDSEYSKQE